MRKNESVNSQGLPCALGMTRLGLQQGQRLEREGCEAPWAECPDRPRELLAGERFCLAELAVWEERHFETGLHPARA